MGNASFGLGEQARHPALRSASMLAG